MSVPPDYLHGRVDNQPLPGTSQRAWYTQKHMHGVLRITSNFLNERAP